MPQLATTRQELQKYITDLQLARDAIQKTKPKLLTMVSQKDRLLGLVNKLGATAQNVVTKDETVIDSFNIDAYRSDYNALLDEYATYMAELGETKTFTGLISNVSFELGLVAIVGLIIYYLRRKK